MNSRNREGDTIGSYQLILKTNEKVSGHNIWIVRCTKCLATRRVILQTIRNTVKKGSKCRSCRRAEWSKGRVVGKYTLCSSINTNKPLALQWLWIRCNDCKTKSKVRYQYLLEKKLYACAVCYTKYGISLRDISTKLKERGIILSKERVRTILRDLPHIDLKRLLTIDPIVLKYVYLRKKHELSPCILIGTKLYNQTRRPEYERAARIYRRWREELPHEPIRKSLRKREETISSVREYSCTSEGAKE